MTFLQVLQSLDSDLVAFRGYIDSIGTNFDGTENRRELKRLRSVIKRKIAESDNKLKEDKERGGSVSSVRERLNLSPLSFPPFCGMVSVRVSVPGLSTRYLYVNPGHYSSHLPAWSTRLRLRLRLGLRLGLGLGWQVK